jgi:hypothetical protein
VNKLNKGEKTLASGNVLIWKHEFVRSRGCISARFTSAPSDADLAEAKLFMESLVPDTDHIEQSGIVYGDQRAKTIMDQLLGRGSSN